MTGIKYRYDTEHVFTISLCVLIEISGYLLSLKPKSNDTTNEIQDFFYSSSTYYCRIKQLHQPSVPRKVSSGWSGACSFLLIFFFYDT